MANSDKVANVAFIRPEIAKVLPLYSAIRDCISGEDTIKKAGDKYLPKPNPEDKSEENKLRYKNYLQRAVFYNVMQRTVNGLVSTVFSKSVDSKIPPILEQFNNDVTGEGLSVNQFAHKMLGFAIAYSRYGVYIDYPASNNDKGFTVAELESQGIRPTANLVAPQHIINWRTMKIGGETVYSLIVIAELYPYNDDGFEIKNSCMFRVYSLVDDGSDGLKVQVETWRENDPSEWSGSDVPKGKNYQRQNEVYYPTDFSGKHLTRIPFSFGGSLNNDSSVDNPIMYDLAVLNLAHYRNSADYEDACFAIGQPTVWVSGLTESWLHDQLGGTIRLGSWGGVPLPANASMGILQVQPNTMPKEAMGHKEELMLTIGAKLVENKTVQRTATEASQDEISNNSILANIANNVSDVIEWCFKTASKFITDSDVEITYRLNNDFDISQYSAELRAQALKEYEAGAITFNELRAVLRRAGIAVENDNDAKSIIELEQAKQLDSLTSQLNNDDGGE